MATSSWNLHAGGRRAVLGRGTLLIALALVAVLAGDDDGRRTATQEPLLDEAIWQHAFLPASPTDDRQGGSDDGPDEPGEPDEPGPPETSDELRERIAEVLARHGVPGVGLALIERDGEIWSGGVGVASRATGAEIDADTMFRVGSITKTVVALAILKLVEEGRLDLDTPVRDIVPEIDMPNVWEDTAPITVAHLLEHTAGFDDARFNEMYVPGELEDGADEERSVADALAQNVRSRVTRWQPGRYYAYSNPGYSVAAAVIEEITGQPFDRYLERSILRPLGMWEASFDRTSVVQRRLAQGHAGRRQQPVPYRRIHHRAAGDLKASPRELARLVKLLLDRGQTRVGPWLRESSIARMEMPATRPPPLPGVSYGLGNDGDPSLPVPTRGHGGGIRGFVSDYRYAPSLGVGWVLLFNSSSEAVLPAYAEIRKLVFDYLTRGMELPAPPGPPASVPAHELARLTGYYELASPRHALTAFLDRALVDAEVRLAGDTLHLRVGSLGQTPLIPVGHDRFRAPGHSAAAVAFTTSEDGSRTLYIMDATFEPGTAWLGNLRRRALTLGYSLMQLGSFWNFLWIPGWLFVMVRTRQRLPMPPGSAPALAALSFFAMLALAMHGLGTGDLGQVTAVSIGCLVLGLAFPVASTWALARSIIELRRGSAVTDEIDELASLAAFGISIYDRGLRSKIYDLGVSVACLGMSLYLAYHGVIGLRTWAW